MNIKITQIDFEYLDERVLKAELYKVTVFGTAYFGEASFPFSVPLHRDEVYNLIQTVEDRVRTAMARALNHDR